MPKSFYLRFIKFPVGIIVMVGSFFIGFHKLIKTATSVAIGNDMPLANFKRAVSHACNKAL